MISGLDLAIIALAITGATVVSGAFGSPLGRHLGRLRRTFDRRRFE
jgi:hypothetical protein